MGGASDSLNSLKPRERAFAAVFCLVKERAAEREPLERPRELIVMGVVGGGGWERGSVGGGGVYDVEAGTRLWQGLQYPTPT